jgi:hypothetical protein
MSDAAHLEVRMRACCRLLIALLCTCAIATVAAAQGTTSRLVGTVTDSTGGVLPGATVTVTNEKTGVNFTTVTSGAGTYNFEALVSGTYTVKVELAGFKTFEATGNPVEIGQPTAVNARLEPGELAETVNVVGASPTVQTATSGNLGSVFQQETITALPIVGSRGRNPLELVTTQPGVVSGANTGGGVHVYGARDRSWNYTLDGIDTNETSAGGSNFSPLRANPDSLQEFKVLTGNQTAEYGRNSGGQVAMVTRSGTNQFRGTLFYLMRDPDLNANEWETNAVNVDPAGADRAKTQFFQDIGGFSLGGPIIRDRTFFFGNLQVLRAKRSPEVVRTVYTDAARKGNWRYVIGGQNRPAGTTGASVDANGNVLPGVNVGNYSIPGSDPLRLGLDSRIQQYIAANMPQPNDFTRGDGLNTAGYRFSPLETEEQYDAVIRVDHVLTDRHYIFGRVAWGEQNTLCDIGNAGQPLYPGMACNVNTYREPTNYMGSWRWNPSGNVVNEFAIGRNQFFFDFQTPTSDASIPYLDFGDITSPQENTTWGNKRDLATLQIVDNLSWVTGAHSLKFGTNIRLQRHQDVRGSVTGGNATPIVDFSTSVNTVDRAVFGIPGDINTSVDLPALQRSINYLLGRVGNYYQGFVSEGDVYAPGGTLFNVEARYPEVDFFAQDTWQFRPNVTVDLGLRWEWKLSPSNPDDLLARPNQRVAVGEPGTSALAWVNEPLYDSDYNNLAPSVGVAWDPGNDGKSVVRGNYRMAFDRINTFAISSQILQSIPGITTGVTNTAYGQAGGRLSGLPTLAPTVTPTQALTPPPVSANSMRVMDTEFETPTTHAWALSYQREVWSRTLVEVAYIGRKADNLFGAYNVNQAEVLNNGFLDAFNVVKAGGDSALMNQLLGPDTRRLPGETGSQLARRLFPTQLATNSVAAMAASIGQRIQNGQTLPQLSGLGPYYFFPYPQYLGGMVVIDSNDWSDYHAFQAKLEKRYSNGYSYLFAYTLARSEDTRSFDPAFTVVGTGSAQSASSTPFNIFDRGLNYARSDFDRTHVITGQFVIELPFGRGKWIAGDAPGWVNQIIGGWDIGSQMYWQSGRPFTVYSGSNTLSNVVQTPANCEGCGYDLGAVFQDPQFPPGSGANTWFFDADDRAKFGVPAAGAFSNVGRNAFIGPSAFNMNLTVSKRIFLPRNQRIELRMDATNFTNTPTFGFPTALITSSTFGRIGTNVISGSRKIQLGIKYIF